VVGVGRSAEALWTAKARGAIDEAVTDIAAGATAADLVLVCTPVNHIAGHVFEAARACRRSAILTDAGSTKAEIVRAVEANLVPGRAGRFVGGHPLAGSEKAGPDHARADLFDGRLVVLTPTQHTDRDALAAVARFWEDLGARVKQMLPEHHDAAVARTSHLPHLVASALAGSLPPDLFELAASGFRDTTRVAAGDPDLWAAIFDQNRRSLGLALDQFLARLAEFRRALSDDDLGTLQRLLVQGKQVRDALGS
jgi:prephenate dehydrogenase